MRGASGSVIGIRHHGQDGNLPILGFFVMVVLLLLVSLVGGIGRAARLKVEVQNTADAVAYSATVPLARAMNALANSQHVSGEFAAIGALHAALDGIYPDGSIDETGPFVNSFFPPGLINAWQVHQDNWERKLTQNPPPTRLQEAHDWFGSGNLGALIQFSLNPKREDFGGGFQTHFIDKNEPYGKPIYENQMAGPTVVGKIGYEAARFAGELTGVMPDPASVAILDKNNRQDANGNWIYDDLRGAIGDSYRRLKVVLFHSYTAQFYAGLLYEESTTDVRKNTKFFKDMTAEALQIAQAALILQKKAVLESNALGELLLATRQTQSMNAAVWNLLAAMDAYSELVVSTAPQSALVAMEGIRGSWDVELFPAEPSLPVVRESPAVAGTESLWVRATTPWVQYHRRQLLLWGQDTILLGRFKDYYWRRTKITTEGIATRMKQQNAAKTAWNPFVMADTANPAAIRGQIWRTDSASADRRFGVVGMAWRENRLNFLPAWMVQPVSDDNKVAAYAQAMLYAASPPVALPAAGYQDTDGWDTLVWSNSVVGHPGPGFETKTGPDKNTVPDTVGLPVPKPDWQVRLVPASRIGEASASLSLSVADFPANLRNLSTLSPAFLAGH